MTTQTNAKYRDQNDSNTSRYLVGLAAFLSFLFSVILFFSGDKEGGIFVGLWVPSILSAGIFLMGGGRHE